MAFIRVNNTVRSQVIGEPARVDPVWIKADRVLWVGLSEDYSNPVTIIKMDVAQIECDEKPEDVIELIERALH